MIHCFISFLFFCAIPLFSLELVKETVILEIQKDNQIHVTVDFTMRGNLSSPFRMAFPETSFFLLENFTVFWNNQKIKTHRQKASTGKEFFIGSLKLPAIYKFKVPATKKDTNTLLTSYKYIAPKMGPTKSPSGIYLEYILQTGSYWENKIGEIVFIIKGKKFHCKKIYVLSGSYEGKCNENNEYVFIANEIEPDKDFKYILLD